MRDSARSPPFLNYLRLIATEPAETVGKNKLSLRAKYPELFDSDLADLASMGKMPQAGPEGPEIESYFYAQCKLFGLDPETFLPEEATRRKK